MGDPAVVHDSRHDHRRIRRLYLSSGLKAAPILVVPGTAHRCLDEFRADFFAYDTLEAVMQPSLVGNLE